MAGTTDTMINPETGETLRRDARPLTLRYRGQEITVEMPGWYPEGDGESIHSGLDGKVSDRALNTLKAREAGLLVAEEIRAIRKKLNLSQVEAGLVLGGGARAYQRYEAGDLLLSRSADSLLRILDASPALLEDLRAHRSHYTEEGAPEGHQLEQDQCRTTTPPSSSTSTRSPNRPPTPPTAGSATTGA